MVTPKPAPSEEKKGMSTGAIVGIIIAIILIILLVVDLFCCFFNHCGFTHCCVETFCTSKTTKYKPTETKDEPEAEELKPLVSYNYVTDSAFFLLRTSFLYFLPAGFFSVKVITLSGLIFAIFGHICEI